MVGLVLLPIISVTTVIIVTSTMGLMVGLVKKLKWMSPNIPFTSMGSHKEIVYLFLEILVLLLQLFKIHLHSPELLVLVLTMILELSNSPHGEDGFQLVTSLGVELSYMSYVCIRSLS